MTGLTELLLDTSGCKLQLVLTQTDHQAWRSRAGAWVSQGRFLPQLSIWKEVFLSYGAWTFDPVHRDPGKKGK